jgi:hypothetical protein
MQTLPDLNDWPDLPDSADAVQQDDAHATPVDLRSWLRETPDDWARRIPTSVFVIAQRAPAPRIYP